VAEYDTCPRCKGSGVVTGSEADLEEATGRELAEARDERRLIARSHNGVLRFL
jgi:hypothetical protein